MAEDIKIEMMVISPEPIVADLQVRGVDPIIIDFVFPDGEQTETLIDEPILVELKVQNDSQEMLDIEFALMGPKGDKGADARSTVTLEMHESVAAFLAVLTTGYKADSSVVGHRNKVLGITTAAIANTFSGEVQYAGEIVNPAWNWNVGDPIFINQGFLSSYAPLTPGDRWCQRIGTATKANAILIELQEPILL